MKYCQHCIMPDTKPDLLFDKAGVCGACRNYERRTRIDWNSRKKDLESTLAKYRSNNSWDCIIPVSGGKDSTFQVVKMLEFGMHPLCVTGTTCDLSEIGRKNIQNIKNLGVDYVEVSPNPKTRCKMNKIGLTQVGDISWPEHLTIFTIPIRVAVQYKIPLVIWGENPQNEYGGPESATKNPVLENRRWLEEFGGLLGLRVTDVIGLDGLQTTDILPYIYPTEEELKSTGITGIFLGHYLPWDGFTNALIAQANGFTTYDKSVEGSIVNYENLDNYQTGIHDYFKYLKFGFGRATDLACLHLRRGRLNRNDAITLTNKFDGKFPWTYLGKPLSEILHPLDISVDEFIGICDQFTNKTIFKSDSKGKLLKDKSGNLFKKIYPKATNA